jgi:hypothetical protein
MSQTTDDWERINTSSRDKGGVRNADPRYSDTNFQFKSSNIDRGSGIFLTREPGQQPGRPCFAGKIRHTDDSYDINWQLFCFAGDQQSQREPHIAIQLSVQRTPAAATAATYFHTAGVSDHHKIRLKFFPNTFDLFIRKVSEQRRNILANEDLVPKKGNLPLDLVELHFRLREGQRLYLEGYPWPFEADQHVMSIVHSQTQVVGPFYLKDLIKCRDFGLILPAHNLTLLGLRVMGNIFFEKGDNIPYRCFRTDVPHNPFATDLVWNMVRFRRVIPQWQAELSEPYREVFHFNRFEDWAISASQGVVQDVFDLHLECEEIRNIAQNSIFVRVFPGAETEEKRESEYLILIKHNMVSKLSLTPS